MKQRKGTRKSGTTRRSTRARVSGRKTARALALPEECGIASAAKLRAALLKRVGDKGCVAINASAVQRVDSAGLQVLAAFARDRRAAGLAVEWAGVTDSLARAAALLSLTDALGLA